MYLGAFAWISWIPGIESLAICGALWGRGPAPNGGSMEDCRLHSCRFGGLEAWRLVGWLACWLPALLAGLLAWIWAIARWEALVRLEAYMGVLTRSTLREVDALRFVP